MIMWASLLKVDMSKTLYDGTDHGHMDTGYQHLR